MPANRRRVAVRLASILALAPAAACAPGRPARVSYDPTTGSRGNEEVVTAFVGAYNRRDIDGMLALADSGIVWLSVAGDSVQVETRGVAALRRTLQQHFRGSTSTHSVLERMTSVGPWVTVHERAQWQSSSGPRAQTAVVVYEIRDFRVRRVWYYPAVR